MQKSLPLPDGFKESSFTSMTTLVSDFMELRGTDPDCADMMIGAITPDGAKLVPCDAKPHKSKTMKVKVIPLEKYNDRAKTSQDLEFENPGYTCVGFNRVHTRDGGIAYAALLDKWDDRMIAIRKMFCEALKYKTWEIKMYREAWGGFRIILDPLIHLYSDTYANALTERVHRVGNLLSPNGDGWFYTVSKRATIVLVYPGRVPDFPSILHLDYPLFASLVDPDKTTFGQLLPEPGKLTGTPAVIRWADAPSMLLSGGTRSGKSIAGNIILAMLVAAGAQLAITDDPGKGQADYTVMRPWLGENMCGYDYEESATGVLTYLKYEFINGGTRDTYWKEHQLGDRKDAPPEVKDMFPIVLLVADELASKALYANKLQPLNEKQSLFDNTRAYFADLMIMNGALFNEHVGKSAFRGMRFLFLSQGVTSVQGVSTVIRRNSGIQLLQGANPEATTFNTMFRSSAPHVPKNVIEAGHSIGTGTGFLPGIGERVVKTMFAGHTDSDGHEVSNQEALADYIARYRREHDMAPGSDDPRNGSIPEQTIRALLPLIGTAEQLGVPVLGKIDPQLASALNKTAKDSVVEQNERDGLADEEQTDVNHSQSARDQVAKNAARAAELLSKMSVL